ncbi:hypothetical protein Tco_0895800 [Tanacetum coccineum]|uniref:Zinc knuckle CX2CX4HX4C n=1 Tax=Tanacetum coccineum TaxID=301880 RepID=A0ABQ5CI30_9ASTR
MIGQAIEGQVTVLDGIAAITSKLVNLGRDMKKLKENIHAIQVGYETCGGMHLDKECPLIEEVKRVEEVKYGEFGRSFPKNSVNEARYQMSYQGYYTRVDNRSPFGNTNMNTRNQNVTLKNLETRIGKSGKDFQAKAAKEAPSTSTPVGHYKAIFT